MVDAPFVPGYKSPDFPAIMVDTVVPDEVRERMLSRIESIFTEHSRDRPHWTVLTSSKYEPDQLDANREQFFRSGHEALTTFKAFLGRAGVDLSSYRTCLELGCGVGRVTLALAELFERVIGCDIAEPMLAEAKRSAAAYNVTNIEWLLTNRFDVYRRLPELDVLFSGIVLQHNPPPVMRHVLNALLGKLRRGGIAYFQLPTYRLGYSFSAEKYLETPQTNDIEMHVFPQRQLFDLLRTCGCQILEIREDGSAGEDWGQISNTLLVEKT
jgi:SAM-dependent methyltransferase